MKSRDVLIGFIALVILIGGVVWLYRNRNTASSEVPIATPDIVERINTAFPGLNIPEGTSRANLKDVSGGESVGVATKTEIVANLPTPQTGQSYKAVLENPEGKTITLGTMRISKSGWIIGYDASKYPGYDKVTIFSGETKLLEGSF